MDQSTKIKKIRAPHLLKGGTNRNDRIRNVVTVKTDNKGLGQENGEAEKKVVEDLMDGNELDRTLLTPGEVIELGFKETSHLSYFKRFPQYKPLIRKSNTSDSTPIVDNNLSNRSKKSPPAPVHVVIIGATLSGLLAANMLALKQYVTVSIFEKSDDIRNVYSTLEQENLTDLKVHNHQETSLLLNARSIMALEKIGITEDQLSEIGSPLHGRVYHLPGATYDTPEHLRTVYTKEYFGKHQPRTASYSRLLILLLNLALSKQNISIRFNSNAQIQNQSNSNPEPFIRVQSDQGSNEQIITPDYIIATQSNDVEKENEIKVEEGGNQLGVMYLRLAPQYFKHPIFKELGYYKSNPYPYRLANPHFVHYWYRAPFLLQALPLYASFHLSLFFPLDQNTPKLITKELLQQLFPDLLTLDPEDQIFNQITTSKIYPLQFNTNRTYTSHKKIIYLGEAGGNGRGRYGLGLGVKNGRENKEMEEVQILAEVFGIGTKRKLNAQEIVGCWEEIVRRGEGVEEMELEGWKSVEERIKGGGVIKREIDAWRKAWQRKMSVWLPEYYYVNWDKMWNVYDLSGEELWNIYKNYKVKSEEHEARLVRDGSTRGINSSRRINQLWIGKL
eukprot:TRINITY_DN6045_c0_g1_i1.p1 TRINITY_DN6045_c0_g1~~TRINITY_DN6045_c0_g1_i1.p1  ORF type:complete len:623 (-),score=178.52 TRINITY_DN6045_c0_g1_i1:49-1896(-)